MRYEDASGAFQASGPIANDDADTLSAGQRGPATGNLITGEGTQYGSAGADSAAGAHITAIAGKGGEDSSFSGGRLSIAGEHGRLTVDAEGNYSYLASGSVENVRDRFTYTIADSQGNSDTAALIVEIGKTPAVIKANAQQIVPGPDGVVTLPPGVELSDVRVVGRNLVVDLPDGTQLIILDGAVFVPQLVLDGVEVPATNVAALLIGQEPQPAAGETPPSSGGNFALPPPPLDPGVPLGDLLPPTEYDYTPPEPEEVLDQLDREPTISIQPDGQPASIAAVDAVNEAGLPERNEGEPEGSGEEAAAGDNGDPSEATTGVILIDSPDGVDSVMINGVLVTGVAGQQIAGEFGTLTITGFDGDNILYSYVLNDNTSGDATHDDFSVTLTDDDGDVAIATLTINIVDDVPTARNDTDAVAQGSQSTDGNVMSGVGTTSAPGGVDTVGADNAVLTGVHAGTSGSFTAVPGGGVTISGQFGDLTINPDGSYTYTLHADVGDGGTEVFTYQLTDGDGDTDTATLTIIVPPDEEPTLDVPNVGEAGTVVDEQGLPARPGEPEGSGEEAAAGVNGDPSETTTGTITFTPGDAPATVTINGVAVTGVGQTFAGDYGTLTITGYDPNGSITYSYTLNDNIDHDSDATPFEEFDVVVTDDDGDTATDTLRIDIVDDAPVANDDTDSVTEDGPLVANGNVITGTGSDGNPAGDDLVGADDSIVTLVDGLNPGVGQAVATPGGVAIVGQYGTLVIHSDGSYTYTLDNTNPAVQALSDGDTLTEQFQYTLLDNDGDSDTAVLTITINGDNDVPTVLVPTRQGPGTIVSEAGLPPRGSEPPGTGEIADGDPNNNSNTSETTSGTVTYTPGDGATTITIDGVAVTGPFPQSFPGDYGTLTITAHDPVAHTISYTYTLADNVDHDSDATPFESFDVVVADSDGNPADDASGTFIIDIINDAPIARDDTDSVVEGASTVGNVLTGVGTTSGAAGADTPGADNYAPNAVVGVVAGDTEANLTNGSGVGVVVAGTWGNLVLNADGSYTYTATAGLNPPPGTTDVFTYTIIDNDGNASNAELIISVIDDLMPTVDVPDQGEAGTSVDEKGLPTRPGEPEGSGEAANPAPNTDNSEITSGTINFTPGDTPATVRIDGVVVTGVVGQTFVGDYGTLVITGYNPAGTITYTYTLADNVDHDSDLTPFETFTVTVTDNDGDVASGDLIINIVNDAPIARDDTDSVIEGAATNGNVLTGVGGDGNPAGADTPGADNYAPNAVVGVVAGDTEANLTNGSGVGVAVVGTYGTLVLNANGTYTYTANPNTNPPPGATDVFTYTIIDNDGNASNAELVISVIDDLVPTANTPALVIVDDDDVIGAGGNAGGPNDDAPQNANGLLTGTGGDGDLDFYFNVAATGAGLPAGFTIDPASTSSNIMIRQGGTLVLTITLNNETGAYTVVQNAPIDHAALNGGGEDNTENNLDFNIVFYAQDADGDPSPPANLTVRVDDDTPTASTAVLAHTVDEDGIVEDPAPGTQEGDGIAGGPDDVGGAVVTANGNVSSLFSPGADQPLTYNINASLASLTAQGLTSGGVALSYSVNLVAGVYTLTATAGPGGETVFTFTLNASTGAYTFTLVDQLDHPTLDGLAGDDTENELIIQLGSMIQATDFDGDTVTAAGNGLNITVDDDTPVAVDDTPTLNIELDQLGVDEIEGEWTDIQMKDGIGSTTGTDVDGDGEIDDIRWGNGVNGGPQSGYGYVDNPDLATQTVLTNQPFTLGTFTHYNNPINGPELLQTTLVVNFVVTIDGVDYNVGPIEILFEHLETTNTGDPEASRDVINITPQTVTVLINGVEYELEVLGLIDEMGNVVSEVRTYEGQANSYDLVVRFVNTEQFELNGNVLTNDNSGADEAIEVVAATGFGGSSDDTPTGPDGTLTVQGQYGTLTINADGSYTYTLTADIEDVPDGYVEHFTYTAEDADGDGTTADLDITLNVDQAADVDDVVAAADDDGLSGGNPLSNSGDLNANTGEEAPGNPSEAIFNGQFVASGGDGTLTYSLANMHGLSGTVGSETVNYSWNAGSNTLTATGPRGVLFTVSVNPATGDYVLTLVDNVLHAPGNNENDATTTLAYRVTDSDGDAVFGNLTVTFDDDMPSAFTPQAASVANEAGGPVFFDLDAGGGDDNINNNVGGDGGTVRFPSSLDGANSGLTSGGDPIVYDLDPTGQILQGKVGATVIFTVTIDQASSQYSIDMNGVVDSFTQIDFTDGSYDFQGGNDPWAAFTDPANDSPDLLITPMINGAPSGTVNENDNKFGVGSGNSVGANEAVRLDFVTDITGNESGSGGYSNAANRDHAFEDHYTTNGASALMSSSTGSTVKISAYDDPDGNDVVGDGALDDITAIAISYGGSPALLITANGVYNVGGVSYTVTFNPDGTVTVAGVEGEPGSSQIGTRIAAYTDDGYNSLVFAHAGGDTFKIGGFGAAVQSTDPVEFDIPVEIVDSDGDVVAGDDIHVTLTPPAAPFAAPFAEAETQLQKSAANSNTLTVAAAVGAAGMSSKAAAYPDRGSNNESQDGDLVNAYSAETVEHVSLDSSDPAVSMLVAEEPVEAQAAESSASNSADNLNDSNGLDDGPAPAEAEASSQAAAEDQGPAHAPADTGAAPLAVAMVSAEQLQAANVEGEAQQGGTVEQIVAEVLGEAAPTVDDVLANLPGGIAELGAIANLTSQDGETVPAWHMGSHGAFGPGGDMLFKVAAIELHHDAVQPVVNG